MTTTPLDAYRPLTSIGRGGMSTIELAADPQGRPVVLKRLIPESDMRDAEAMFRREAHILEGLDHPGVVGIRGFHDAPEGPVMALDYVHGHDLHQWLRFRRRNGERIGATLAAYVVCQVLDTLAHVHDHERPDGRSARVVHRDISPSNILLDVDGRVLLTDFGIACLEATHEVYRTSAHVVKGKLPYLPPERLQGAPATAAGDVYACALTLHQMLVGRNELVGEAAEVTISNIQRRLPSSVEATRDDVPVGVDAVLRRALDKDPAARFTDARSLATALRVAFDIDDAACGAQLRREVSWDFHGPMADELRIPSLAQRSALLRGPRPRTDVLTLDAPFHERGHRSGRRSLRVTFRPPQRGRRPSFQPTARTA